MISKFEVSARSGAACRIVRVALTAGLLSAPLAGCKTLEEPGAHSAGYIVAEPHERHPILVAQQPATMDLRIAPGSQGLTSSQRAQVEGFLARYRSKDNGNSKLLIGIPHGGANEMAAMRAASQLSGLIKEAGFAENDIQIRPYQGGGGAAPIRFSYMRYVARGPACGIWDENVARNERNLNYPNFGCAQQANLAAMIANPGDLVAPRTMEPADAERRAVVHDRYRQGRSTASEKGADDNGSTKSNN